MQREPAVPGWLSAGVLSRAGVASNAKLLRTALPEIELGAREWEDLPLVLVEHLDRQLRAPSTPSAEGRRRLVGAMQRAAWARLARSGKPAALSADLVEAVGKCCGDAESSVADRERGFVPAVWLYANLQEPSRFVAHAQEQLAERLLDGWEACRLELEIELLEALQAVLTVEAPVRETIRCMREMVLDVQKSYKLGAKYQKWRERDPGNPTVGINVAVFNKAHWPSRQLKRKLAIAQIPHNSLPDLVARCMDSYTRFYSERLAKQGRRHVPDRHLVPLPEGCPPPPSSDSAVRQYSLKSVTLVLIADAAVQSGDEVTATEWNFVYCRAVVHPTHPDFKRRELKHFTMNLSLCQHAVLDLFNDHGPLTEARIGELIGVDRAQCERVVTSLSHAPSRVLKATVRATGEEKRYEPNPNFSRSLYNKTTRRAKKSIKFPLANPKQRLKGPEGGPGGPGTTVESSAGSRMATWTLTPAPKYPQNTCKSKTGFCGLSNQGATCYLNSLLQSLYMTPEFKHALYLWQYNEVDDGPAEECVPFQLQKLFANMDTCSDKAVTTNALTRSFGWTGSDSFVQHDVQELCRVLYDALEEALRGTQQSDLIKTLYEGELCDYVQCVECQHQSTRKDTFLDVQLPLRQFGEKTTMIHSVEEGLSNFLAPETLDGDNKWFCEHCQKRCAARKGLRFDRLPYLLTLQLKRFDYDYETNTRVKLGGEVEFPETLDMAQFVVEPASARASSASVGGSAAAAAAAEPPASEHVYQLFGILIHAGNARFGHYYAYILDFATRQWLEFNDSTVTALASSDIHRAFGSATASASGSAYMLLYRRVDKELNQEPIKWTLADMPGALAAELEKERQQEAAAQKKREVEQNQAQVRVYTSDGRVVLLATEKTCTIRDAITSSLAALYPGGVDIPVARTRLRKYGEALGICYEECDADSKISYNESFLLETCPDHARQVFGPHASAGPSKHIFVKMSSFQTGSTVLLSPPTLLEFAGGATRADLIQAIAQVMGVPVDSQQQLYRCLPTAGAELKVLARGNDTDLLQGQDLRLESGTLMFVEIGEPADSLNSAPVPMLIGEEMDVTMKTVRGDQFQVKVGQDNTVWDLKLLFPGNVAADMARLVHTGKELKDGFKIKDVMSVSGGKQVVFVVPTQLDLQTLLPVYRAAITLARTANVHFTDVDAEQPVHLLQFDMRQPLGELKSQMGAVVGADPAEFSVYTNELNKSKELKQQDQPVESQPAVLMKFTRMRFVLSLKKRVVPLDQIHKCRIFLFRRGQPLVFLCPDVVNACLTGKQYKDELAPKLHQLAAKALEGSAAPVDDTNAAVADTVETATEASAGHIAAELQKSDWAALAAVTPQTLRLREPRISVLLDTLELRESLGMFREDQQLAVEILDKTTHTDAVGSAGETKTRIDQAVVTVYIWRPESFTLDEPRELLVDTRWPLSQLRIALHSTCFAGDGTLGFGGLVAEDVGIAQHGDGYGPPPPELDIPGLAWDKDKVAATAAEVKTTVDGMVAKVAMDPAAAVAPLAPAPSPAPAVVGTVSTLCGPHYFARDEKVFFCRDNRATLRELLPEEREKMETEAQAVRAEQHANAKSAAAPTKVVRVAEQQLKIRVRKREAVPETDAAEQADQAVPMSTGGAVAAQQQPWQPPGAAPALAPSVASGTPQPTAAQLSQLMLLMGAASRAVAPDNSDDPANAPMEIDDDA